MLRDVESYRQTLLSDNSFKTSVWNRTAAPKLNMQETWDEAHRMFREKMKVKAKENPKQEIEVPDDDGKPAFPTLSN